jgi:DNA-binding FadR family transcriptional regulator
VIAIHLLKGLEESSYAYFRMKQFTQDREKEDLLRRHKATFEAIRKNDGKVAKQSMLEQLDYLRGMIKQDLVKNVEGARDEAQ